MLDPIGSETGASNAPRFDAPETANGHDEAQTSPSDDGSVQNLPALTRNRFSTLTRRTKVKTRKIFKLEGAAEDDQSKRHGEGPPDNLGHDPAFNSSQLVKKKRFRPGKTADKTLGAIQSIGNAVVHPVSSVQSTATRTTASQLSKAERPFSSQKADKELLQAHDNLKRAEYTGSLKQGASDEEHESLISGHRDKIREMEAQRESLRAAWTTTRYVRRVRVVPKRHLDSPDNGNFVEKDDCGELVRYDWLKWLGYVILHRSRYWTRVLTLGDRILSTIPKTSALNTLTTLKSFLLILIAQDVMLNDW